MLCYSITFMYQCITFSKRLVIVESPTKCKTIESFLGSEYKVIACYGHLREITSLSNIDIQHDFKPTYTLLDKKKGLIEKIRKEIQSAYEVILATDNDREGDAIAWHICDIYQLSIENTKRILFHEITEDAICRAIENPIRLNMNRVYSQQARQVIDLMVGYTMSPILWRNIINTSVLSAGRCQTPTLRLIYENHLKRTNGEISSNYSIVGYFTSKSYSFELNHRYESESEIISFLEHSRQFEHIISSSIEKKKKAPPMPLTTSQLLRESPYSATETMHICQKLYEDGLITYMRTESTNYSREFVSSVHSFIRKEYQNDKYIGSSSVFEGETSAHEAIRPTNILLRKISTQTYTQKEMKLYQLIWEISLESLMSFVEYDEQCILITAPFDLKYTKKIKLITFQGWNIVKNRENNSSEYHYFLHFKMNRQISYNHILCKPNYSFVPYLSETDLLTLLERHGIGRPSTYASLIQKIQDRKYVVKQTITRNETESHTIYELSATNQIIEKKQVKSIAQKEHNKLVIQPLGIEVIEYLIKYPHLFDYEFTQKMEDSLDEILSNEKSYIDICKIMYDTLSQLTIKNGKEEKEGKKEKNEKNEIIKIYSTILREINGSTSIRTNKYGNPYIYYKTPKMKRPKFYSVDHFEGDYMNCDSKIILNLMRG